MMKNLYDLNLPRYLPPSCAWKEYARGKFTALFSASKAAKTAISVAGSATDCRSAVNAFKTTAKQVVLVMPGQTAPASDAFTQMVQL